MIQYTQTHITMAGKNHREIVQMFNELGSATDTTSECHFSHDTHLAHKLGMSRQEFKEGFHITRSPNFSGRTRRGSRR